MTTLAILKQIIHDNSAQDWLLALSVLVSSMLVFELLRRIALRRLRKLQWVDHVAVHLIIDVLRATRVLLSAAIAGYMALQFLQVPESAAKLADRIFIALLMLQSGFWIGRVLDFLIRQRLGNGNGEDDGARAMTRTLLSFLGRVVLWSLVALLILDNMGLNVTTLVASMGIGGVAVALAVQNILGDLFASLSIAIDKPFVIGDYIVVDDLMGTVEHVGLKTTRIRSLNGEQIIFSNNDLLKSRIRNYKRMQERRAVFAIGVTYDTPHEKLQAIPALIRAAIEEQECVRFTRAHFKAFGPFSLDFEAVYHVLSPEYNDYMDVQQAINLELVRVFTELGIEFAFPTQTLHVSGDMALKRSGAENWSEGKPA